MGQIKGQMNRMSISHGAPVVLLQVGQGVLQLERAEDTEKLLLALLAYGLSEHFRM